MYNVKVNLNILLPGRTMLSEQECSRKVRKPLLFEKGKKKGEQVKDKKGNAVWYTAIEPDPQKTERVYLEGVKDSNGNVENIVAYCRGNKPAKQVMSICEEAYWYFISTEMPLNFIPPKGYEVPDKKVINRPYKERAWISMTPSQRLEWHLKDIARSVGGIVDSYVVFDD